MADFEFFKKQFEFKGKHSRMVSELCVANDFEHTFFRRVIDVYVFAAIIGIRLDRKASEDYSPVETKKYFSGADDKCQGRLGFHNADDDNVRFGFGNYC